MIGGPPLWAAKYQALPFAERRDAVNGTRCWGLVRMIYRGELGIDLPAHAEISADDALAVARAIRGQVRSGRWTPVANDDWRDFDVVTLASYRRKKNGVLLRYRGHVGIVAGPRFILHVEQEIESTCVARDDEEIARRILGAFRYCP